MKLAKPHSFEDRLQEGVEWEEKIKPKLKQKVMNITIEQIDFTEDPDKQLSGIDQVLHRSSDLNIDVKTRDSKYCCSDILIETISIVEKDKPGWVYNESTDIVCYTWKNKVGDNLQDGILLLLNGDFVSWFDGNKEKFDTVRAKSYDKDQIWHTENKVVPIEDIPNGFYMQFDPKLPTDKVTNQSKLSDLD